MFVAMDADKSGTVTLEEFREASDKVTSYKVTWYLFGKSAEEIIILTRT